jgi:hypothetical protein
VNRPAFSALIGVLLMCSAGLAHAKELDQFTDRLVELHYYSDGYRDIQGALSGAQVDAVLDARMNWLLDKLQQRLADDALTDAQREKHVRRVFQHRYLPQLITPYEEWAKQDAPIPLYKVRDKGIYGHAVDYDDMRMTWYIELSPIVQVAGVLIGIDKLGHYLAQGYEYYEHYRQLAPQLSAAERYHAVRQFGHDQEVRQLGLATGGVYSFADLAANWSGMLFFMALFDAVDVEGVRHRAYFERDERGHYRRVRAFHWSEWVSADWDEVRNPSRVDRFNFYRKIAENFARHSATPSICTEYRQDPDAYLAASSSQALIPRERYALPLQGERVAPYAIDVRDICGGAAGATH